MSPARPRRRLRPRTKLTLVLVGTAMALLLLEGAARILAFHHDRRVAAEWEAVRSNRLRQVSGDAPLGVLVLPSDHPDVIYRLRPGLDVRHVGQRLRTNEHGFRGGSYTVEKPPSAFRIVGLGDSVMFGHGVGDGDTFLAVLERELSASLPDLEVQVINTAAPGYNTAMEVALLEARGLAFEPDIVVIDFVANDTDLPNFIAAPRDPFALDRSFLVDWIARWSTGSTDGFQPLQRAPVMADNAARFESAPERVPSRYRHMVGEAACRNALARLKELGRRHGFAVVVSCHYQIREFAAKACRDLGLPLVHAAPFVEEYMAQHGIDRFWGSELTISESDPHPTAIVHRIQGQILARYLLERDLVTRALFRRLTSGGGQAAAGSAVARAPADVRVGGAGELRIDLANLTEPDSVRAAGFVVIGPAAEPLVVLLKRESSRTFRLPLPGVQMAPGRYRLVPALHLASGPAVRLPDTTLDVLR